MGNIDGADIDITAGTGDYTTSGLGTFGNLDVDTLNLNGNVISDSTGTISFADENLTTTGNLTIDSDSNALILGDGQDASWAHDGTDVVLDILQATNRVVINPDGDDTDFVFGSAQLEDVGTAAQDARMFFDKGKGAFRAGTVTSTQWDAVNVGDYSAAMGVNTTASGTSSFAMGSSITASGDYSFAMGVNATASGDYSVAMGGNTTASGNWSVAMGGTTIASGDYSCAFGKDFTNSTINSFAVGFGQKDFDVQSGAVRAIGTLSAGDGESTNYAKFAADGELTLYGTARVTKRIVMAAADYGHGAVPPDSTVVGKYHVWSYDLNDDSVMSFELPPDWATGTDITISVDWAIDEAYAVDKEIRWEVTWAATPHDGSEALDAPTHTGTLDPGDKDIPSVAKTLDRTLMGSIPNASLAVGDDIGITLKRIAIGAGDNPTADPFVIHLTIEYIADKLGEAT